MMGRDGNFACVTCKLSVYLGYGSYSTWLDGAQTLGEYDALPRWEDKKLTKNMNVRRFLQEHEGHEIKHWSSDWIHFHGAVLCYEGPECNPVLDLTGYTRENWYAAKTKADTKT